MIGREISLFEATATERAAVNAWMFCPSGPRWADLRLAAHREPQLKPSREHRGPGHAPDPLAAAGRRYAERNYWAEARARWAALAA